LRSLKARADKPDVAQAIAEFWQGHRTQIMALMFSVAITAIIIIFRRELARLSTYGYLGVFLISVIGNATVIFPVPSLAVVFAGGGILNPLLVGLIAGVGEPLGELTGYLAGYGGSAVIENRERFEQIKGWMERRGFITIFILSVIPNPFFDLAGLSAGMLRFPVTKFLLACWLGKSIKALALAYIGSLSIDLLAPFLG
jgi:uncharacterized membrane protein YdjX (TVP38/TMEM64 family)